MARRIRWYIPFMSFNGISCRVNIYDEDYPETNPQFRLPAADEPFFYEDESSSDIINNVLRYRTGYIRFIRRDEEEFTDLDAIYPTTQTARYVEVLYGSDIVFNGYIQMQDFSLIAESNPREIELPVISPLGLMVDQQPTTSLYSQPRTVTLGEALFKVVGSTWENIIVPDISVASLSQNIFSLVIEPWNEDFSHIRSRATPTNVQRDRSFIVEAICKAFGWIAHDTPGALVFTSFDWTGNYASYPASHIGESSYKTVISIPTTAVTLESYYQLADNNAVINNILPETGIKIEYEGELLDSVRFEFGRTYFDSVVGGDGIDNPGERFTLCNFTVPSSLQEVQSIAPAIPDADNVIPQGTKALVAWKNYTGILWSAMQSLQAGSYLFKLRFYRRRASGIAYILNYKCLYGKWFQVMVDNEDVKKYFNGSIIFNGDYVEVEFRLSELWNQEKLDNNSIVMFHDIELEGVINDEPYARYRFPSPEEGDFISADESSESVPIVSSTITMPISMYRRYDTLIGDSVKDTKVTTYRYMFQQRKELVSKFYISQQVDMPYMRLFNYLGKNWRLIAQKFYPRDDEVTLTMEHSPILSNN